MSFLLIFYWFLIVDYKTKNVLLNQYIIKIEIIGLINIKIIYLIVDIWIDGFVRIHT